MREIRRSIGSTSIPHPSMPIPISARTSLLGVLGQPVRHSLSPEMHNAALAELGLDWVYLALPTPPAHLATVVRALEAMDCRGISVTIPHKQAVAPLTAELTPLARRLGAVNTLVRRPGGGWLGTNTDVEGFVSPLRTQGSWGDRQALVMGCGGSARAVVAGLVELGLGRIWVAGRRVDRLETFVAECRSWAPALEPHAWTVGGLGERLTQCDLVVNTTPVGMAGTASGSSGAGAKGEDCPLVQAELDQLQPGTTVYDLIYTPRPTPLLRDAGLRGCTCLDGLEMLVQQGAAALRLWSGLEQVPVASMRQALLARLSPLA